MRETLRLTMRTPALLTVALLLGGAVTGATEDRFDALRWRHIGPVGNRVSAVYGIPGDPNTYYFGAASGGVFKTTDNGVTLVPVFEREGTHSVGAIALHQRDTSIVWVGTGERANRQSSSWGDGVYKSTDGGRTWTNMGLRDSKHIGRIALHPTDTDLVYVAAMGHLWGPNEERGLYRSADGGNTWEPLLRVDENTGVVDVALDPAAPTILHPATYPPHRRPWGFPRGGPPSAPHRRVDRRANHLAFGYGPHVCLGQHLARMELAALYRELLNRVDRLELNGEPAYTRSTFVGGLKSLPIRYRMK